MYLDQKIADLSRSWDLFHPGLRGGVIKYLSENTYVLDT